MNSPRFACSNESFIPSLTWFGNSSHQLLFKALEGMTASINSSFLTCLPMKSNLRIVYEKIKGNKLDTLLILRNRFYSSVRSEISVENAIRDFSAPLGAQHDGQVAHLTERIITGYVLSIFDPYRGRLVNQIGNNF